MAPSIQVIQRSQPPAFSFAATNVGSTSSDSPKSVQVENIGNQPLIFTTPASGTNPSYPASFPAATNDFNLSSAGMSLAPGTSCDVSLNFAPTIPGANTGVMALTDNALNVAGATQSIAASGSAPALLSATVTVTPSSSTITTAQPLIVAIGVSGASGHPTPTGSVTLSSGSYTSAATTLSGGAASISIPAGPLTTGLNRLEAIYSGDNNYSGATAVFTRIVISAPSFEQIAGLLVQIAVGADGSVWGINSHSTSSPTIPTPGHGRRFQASWFSWRSAPAPRCGASMRSSRSTGSIRPGRTGTGYPAVFPR